MDLSIIMCTYNRFKRLNNTFRHLEAMVIPEGLTWDIVVIDNNSDDNTRGVVEDFCRRDALNISYLFEPRQGKSFALNRGLEQVSGEIIAFLDDDVVVDKGWLIALIDATRKYRDCDGFGGRIVSLWQDNLPDWLELAGTYNSLRGTGYLRDEGTEDKDYSQTESRVPCGANMFFRKAAVQKNGFFREDLGPLAGKPGAAEDTEYCFRMLKAGRKLMYIGKALVYHKVEADKLTKTYLTKWRYYCSRCHVRAFGTARSPSCYFSVPRYLFRQLCASFIKWNLSINSRRRFYERLRFFWTLGEIFETHKLENAGCTLTSENPGRI